MEDPIAIFKKWYQEELKLAAVQLPAACCFSTVGEDGYPNARFVSLKEVKDGLFIITGPTNSKKGKEIKNNPKVSLTFWWTATRKHIRIQGDATILSEADASVYFEQRNRDSKIVSSIFEQGKSIESFELLSSKFEKGKLKLENRKISKPIDWLGFGIQPIRIELMEFQETRLHKRTLFIKSGDNWEKMYLQP